MKFTTFEVLKFKNYKKIINFSEENKFEIKRNQI